MDAVYSVLLFYSEGRWFSRGKCLQRVYELREEIAVFLNKENRPFENITKKSRSFVMVSDEIGPLGRHI